MSYLEKVESGKKQDNYFICILGASGVGKSSWAAQAPFPIFIDIEGGTTNMDVKRMPAPTTTFQLLEMIQELKAKEHPYKTLVIDSIDWLEQMLWRDISVENNVKSVSDIPYGRGYDLAAKKWGEILKSLKELKEKMNVILIAHSEVKSFTDPMTGSYDRYQIKLHAKSSSLVKEAVDAVLFATYEIFLKKDGLKNKAFGDGSRVLLSEYRPTHDGKNRFGLPYQLPLDWESFLKAAQGGGLSELRTQILSNVQVLKDEEVKKKVLESTEKAGTDRIQLSKILERLLIIVGEKNA